MQYISFNESSSYEIAVLIKSKAFNKNALEKWYVNNISTEKVIGIDLLYENNKAPAKLIAPYLDEVLFELKQLNIKNVICADGNYFKKLVGARKLDNLYGYSKPCVIKGYEDINVFLVPNYESAVYDHANEFKINLGIEALNSHLKGEYKEIGNDVIKYSAYVPCNVEAVRKALFKLLDKPSITCDTETFSLVHNRAGIGTIGFAWSESEGICIDVVHSHRVTGKGSDWEIAGVMIALREFFETYRGNIKYHNATYDIKVLIRWLWMTHLRDTGNLIKGLTVMTRDFDCTRAISYLATNNAQENKLSLKEQAHEFLGKYAVDVTDITKVITGVLQEYNLKDCLATHYVYNKNYPLMVEDDQLDFYVNMAKPILRKIIQMELTGMPLNIDRVLYVRNKLRRIVSRYTSNLLSNPLVVEYSKKVRVRLADKYNAEHKTKRKLPNEMSYTFNPNSDKQVGDLIHNVIGLPVVSTTKTGQPQTGNKILKGHLKRTDDKQVKNILKCIIKITEGIKILSTFIDKFVDSERDDDGWYWLFGSFNFGGTKSGRLSSSDPNLQNLPSGSTYGKLVKSCFQAPKGITKVDSNKLSCIIQSYKSSL